MKRGVYFTPENEGREVRLGIPSKGRGQQLVWELLESCKILPSFSEDLRENPFSLDKSIVVVAERQLDIARDLGLWNLDLGIVGEDMLMEANYPAYSGVIEVLAKLGGRCRVSLIGKQGMDVPKPLRIATKLPVIAERFIKEMKLNAVVIEREGALETTIRQGIADAIIDQVMTGRTLASFGLREMCVIMESQFVLAANKQSIGERTRGIKALVDGVNMAKGKNLVIFNIPERNIGSLMKDLPACKSPTISSLADKKWSSVSTVVSDGSMCGTISKIRANGGQDLLVSPVRMYLSGDKPRQSIKELYGRILERKKNPVVFSRTTRYLRDERDAKRALAKKFIGECKEFVDAIRKGKKEGKDSIAWEAADSIYFFLAMAASRSEEMEKSLSSPGKESTNAAEFMRISRELADSFEICSIATIDEYDFEELQGKGLRKYEIATKKLEVNARRWIAAWRSLLEESDVSEEEVELENGGRDKG